jgi:hypothetical protein
LKLLRQEQIGPCTAMTGCSLDIALTFPPRRLRPQERGILAEWLVAPGNPASAYTNERRSDPPSLYRKIVVTSGEDTRPKYLVWAARGVGIWIVQEPQTGKLCNFGSLRDALHSIWEELPGGEPGRANMIELAPDAFQVPARPPFSDEESELAAQWSSRRTALNFIRPVSERTVRDLLPFPARLPTPEESNIVAEWSAAAGDVAFAYVSSRQDDDPALLHRIIIGVGPNNRPSHIVHAPSSRDIWMVFAVCGRKRVSRFLSLRDALNSIRPVRCGTP